MRYILSRRSFLTLATITAVQSSRAHLWAAVDSAVDLFGRWRGVMIRNGQSLTIEFDFSKKQHVLAEHHYYCPMDRQVHSDHPGKCPICGMDLVLEDESVHITFTSLTQSAMEYPLEQISIQGSAFRAVLGDSIVLNGKADHNTLAGTFKDGEADGTFELHRSNPAKLPYRTKTVSFVNGTVTLAGTLCIPRSPRKCAAVVLLHGSGAQTRWGTNRYLADQFARAGIIALAFDKRGSGESTGQWETSSYEDLAHDALAGVEFLRSLSEVDRTRIGLHGHSEGGIVAPVAVTLASSKIAFVVAEDTVAGLVYQQDLYRTHLALNHSGFNGDQIAAADRLYGLFIDAARGVKPREELRRAMAEAQQAPWFNWLGLPDDNS
jgi:Heavy metal binding domain/Serine aminopeptidase, S33